MTGSRPRALIVDYGGVLTSSLTDAVAAWLELDDIDRDEFDAATRVWLSARGETDPDNPVHALETGALPAEEFQRRLAARLRTRSGGSPAADGLLRRMFADFRSDPVMVEAVRRARAAGISTALLSNSWGLDYSRDGWDELFSVVVISGEVGLRKPDPAIYRLAAERVGVTPADCVFVDDLRVNVAGAESVGMPAVHHSAAAATVARLEELLGVALQPGTAGEHRDATMLP